jgi:hypothetical protein
MSCQWLWSTWVKSPILKSKKLYIVSACLPQVNKELYERICSEGTVLLACPEKESPTYYGKLASMLRSNEEFIEELIIITIDGSPHCFTLQASVNEAEYILGRKIKREHYVLVNGTELINIDPNVIRIARYLHIVNKLIRENPSVVRELSRCSLEYVKTQKY